MKPSYLSCDEREVWLISFIFHKNVKIKIFCHWDLGKAMKIKITCAKSFYSDRLSNTKYQEIHSFAQNLIDQKNYLSAIVNKNLTFYLSLKKHEFKKNTLPLLKDKVNSHFVKQLQDESLPYFLIMVKYFYKTHI